MAVITRNDGAQFVIQAYREVLSTQKRSLIGQELRLLAEQHGEYIHLSMRDGKKIEAAFSKDTGYLLAESIWEYFGQPRNLIYCEALRDDDVLLVVIRSGDVYLDTKITNAELRSELAPLMLQKQSFEIITAGKVALTDQGEEGFQFPEHLVRSFSKIQEPLLQHLPLNDNLQFQPLVVALKSNLMRQKSPALLTAMVVAVIALAGWWFFSANPSRPVNQIKKQTIQQNPYAAYYNALTAPAPQQQFIALTQTIGQLYFLPGWSVQTLNYHNAHLTVHLRQGEGNLTMLGDWAERHHFDFDVTPQGVILAMNASLPKRPRPQEIFPLQPVVVTIIDRLHELLTKQAIQLNAEVSHGAAQESKISVRVDNASPNLLLLIGRELQGLPVAVSTVNLRLQSGMVSGTIQLSVWGT